MSKIINNMFDKIMDKKTRIITIIKYLAIILGFLTFFLYYFEANKIVFWIVFGLFALSLGFSFYWDYRYGRATTKKRFSSAIYFVLVFFVAVLFYLFTLKYPISIDLTEQKLYSLSDKTKETLAMLPFKVKILVFQDDKTPDFGGKDSQRIYETLKNTLEEYKRRLPTLQVEYINPDKDSIRVKNYKIRNVGDIIVESETGKKYIEKMELVKWKYQQSPFGQIERVIEGYLVEEKITGALLSLMETGKTVLLWLEGDGEVSLETKEGASFFKEELENNNIEIKKVSSFEKTPLEGSLLFIAGPSKTIPKERVADIEAFIQKGKPLVVLVDPNLDSYETGLEELLKKYYNVTLHNHIVVDPKRAFQSPINIIPAYGDHLILNALKQKGLGIVLPMASRITGPKAEEVLLKGSESAWIETNIKEVKKTGGINMDKKQPAKEEIILGAIVENKEHKSKLLIITDGDFIRNGVIQVGGNKDFIMNALFHILEKKVPLSISKPIEKERTLTVDEGQKRIYFFIFVIFIPLLIIVFGIKMFMVRKKLRSLPSNEE